MRGALCVAAALFGACDRPVPLRAAAPRLDAPFARAAELRRELRGTEGEERARARRRAAAAYLESARDLSRPPAERAEAAFRGAELLRAGGSTEEAAAWFERCRELAPEGPFGARAQLELGHVHRRAGRADPALAAYELLVADARAEPRLRERAAWWIARVEADRGRDDAARRGWERLARGDGDPLLRVRAAERWVASLVEAGRLEEAAGALELCRAGLRPRAQERSELGRRLRAALAAMRSPALLAEAVAARRAAAPH